MKPYPGNSVWPERVQWSPPASEPVEASGERPTRCPGCHRPLPPPRGAHLDRGHVVVPPTGETPWTVLCKQLPFGARWYTHPVPR